LSHSLEAKLVHQNEELIRAEGALKEVEGRMGGLDKEMTKLTQKESQWKEREEGLTWQKSEWKEEKI